MKALTIWQPWASLIMAGVKPYEFRSWAAPRSLVGQRIAIHAGARPMRAAEIHELLEHLGLPRTARGTGLAVAASIPILERAWRRPELFPLKHVLGTALLGQPRRACEIYPDDFSSDSDRLEHSNWAWPLTAIEHLEPPVPARGAQGLWDWHSSLLPGEAGEVSRSPATEGS